MASSILAGSLIKGRYPGQPNWPMRRKPFFLQARFIFAIPLNFAHQQDSDRQIKNNEFCQLEQPIKEVFDRLQTIFDMFDTLYAPTDTKETQIVHHPQEWCQSIFVITDMLSGFTDTYIKYKLLEGLVYIVPFTH